jgi:hypothetical protein
MSSNACRDSRIFRWSESTPVNERELVVAMDVETPLSNPVRYTQDQRRKETRVAQYRAEGEREKSNEVREAEKRLADYNSKTAHTDAFCGYCDECLRTLSLRLAHYGSLQHRRQRYPVSASPSEFCG